MPQRALSPQELAAIEDEIVAKAPAGLSDEEFDRYFGPKFAEAQGIAEHLPAPLQGSSLKRALSGLWSMTNPIGIASGLAQAVRHPIDTGTNIVRAQVDQGRQAFEAAKDGRVFEAAGHGAASLLPVVGPLAAQTGERIAEGDVAGGLGQTAGLLAPFAVSGAVQAARGPAKAKALEQTATQQVADRVLAPGNLSYRGRAQALAPEVLQRGLTGDRNALREAAQAGMDAAGQAIDDAIQAAGGPRSLVQTGPIIAQIRDQIAKLTYADGMPIKGAEGKVAALRQHITQLQQQSRGAPPRAGLMRPGPNAGAGTPGQPPGAMPFDKVRDVRDVNYGRAREAKGYERAGNVKMGDEGWAAREVGDAIRREFADKSPDLAAANADYHFFKTLDEVLDPAIGRPKATAPPAGVTGGARTTGAVAGAVTGSPLVAFIMGEVRPWLAERAARPEWLLADAHKKMQLAEAIRAGRIGKARRLMVTWGEVGPKGPTSPTEPQALPDPASLAPATR